MALISQSIKNLKGGISQQPDILRYSEQGAEQVNGWSSESSGLQKRPPSLHLKTLGAVGYLGDAPMVHLINRDEYEQYYVVFTGKSIKVFDLSGKEYAVRGDFSYVTTANPREDLRMVTVADYTFITNRTRTVETDDTIINQSGFKENGDALVNIRGGQFGRRLSIEFNGMERGVVQLPDGSKAEHTAETDAQAIAEKLAADLRNKLGNPNNDQTGDKWKFNVGSGYIHIIAPDNDNIVNLITKDGYADQLINPVTHYSQSFQKLPINAPNGYTVKIVGDTSKTSDQYYVKYDLARKVWVETLGWNQRLAIKNHTMPWALVRAADGNFDFKAVEWNPRTVGDDTTNPFPSFCGQAINDIFFFRNRLGFLSGENIILSRTSRYFNFFPASVSNYSDDDPIDVAVSHNRVSILKYAVPFSEELLLWSDQAQFVLSASGILSSKTVELNLTTQFDVQDRARPYGIGRNVYFPSPRATFTSINRYYAVQDVSAVKNAEDITAHVPSYIPNGVFSISGTTAENFAAVLSAGAPSRVYIYKFLYIEEEIRQQSWSHWDFGSNVTVFAAQVINSTMTLLLGNQHHVWMARIVFTKHTTDYPNEPYRIQLDSKTPYTIPAGKYNEDSYQTTLILSEIYGMNFQTGKVSVVYEDGKIEEFNAPQEGWAVSPYLRLNGNQEGQRVFIGFNMQFTYQFSKFLIKKTAEDGSTATEDIGRLQLRRAWVNYEDSGAFTIRVRNVSSEFVYTMAGARLGSEKLLVGRANVGTGQYRFPVVGNASKNVVTIESDETTPMNLIGCGWEGNYLRRTSGI